MIDTEVPTERLVAEAVFYIALDDEDFDHGVPWDEVVSLLQEFQGLTYAEAWDRTAAAVLTGEVVWDADDDTALVLDMPDIVTEMRLARRLWWHRHHEETGEMIPVRLPGDCAVVRAAIEQTVEMFGHSQLEDVIVTMDTLRGWPEGRGWLTHAVLNALDVGAVHLHQYDDDWYLTAADGWHEGLES